MARKPLTKIVEPEIQLLSFDAMEILPDLLQTRAKTDPEVSHQYAEWMRQGADFPAVVVFLTPDGRFLLADGFHRVDAAKRLGLRAIRARIIHGSIEDAILFGIDQNMALKKFNAPTPDDRHHAVKLMIRNETFRQWSDAEIGKRCGVSVQTVLRTRLKLRDSENIPLPENVVCFSNGQPTKKTQRYKPAIASNAWSPNVIKAGRGFHVKLGGKTMYLGTNLEESNQKLCEKLNDMKYHNIALRNLEGFTRWLITQGLNIENRGRDSVGGSFLGDALVFFVPDPTYDVILRSIGVAILSRVESPEYGRAILVGYFGFESHISRTVNLASKLSPPIEFMTPEEFVAEFSPKSDTGESA